jgi:hypothetical protein
MKNRNVVTVTNAGICEAFMAVQQLAVAKLPVKTSYWVGRLLARLNAEYKAIEKRRGDLIKEIGSKMEGTGNYEIKPEDKGTVELYQKTWTEQMEASVELKDIPVIKIETLGNISIEPSVLSALDPFLDSSSMQEA